MAPEVHSLAEDSVTWPRRGVKVTLFPALAAICHVYHVCCQDARTASLRRLLRPCLEAFGSGHLLCAGNKRLIRNDLVAARRWGIMPAMSQFQKHLFVCTNGPYCTFDGDPDQLFNQLKKLVSAAGLTETVRVNRSGCLNQCGHGPVAVVYPEGVWYTGVSVEDAAEIVSSHLINDCPVQRLVAQLPPGNNKDTGGYPEEIHAFKQIEDELARRRLVARDEIRARLEQAAISTAS